MSQATVPCNTNADSDQGQSCFSNKMQRMKQGFTDGVDPSSKIKKRVLLCKSKGSQGFKNFEQFVSFEAVHDSSVQRYVDQVIREKTLNKSQEWIDDPNATEQIIWLRGPANIGKTAIALEIARQEKVAATFFFNRSDSNCSDGNRLFTTLAWQLATSIPHFKDHMLHVINKHPDLPKKCIEDQFEYLIVRPFAAMKADAPTATCPVVIIDGVDECVDVQLQQRFLKIIEKAISDRAVPLRFIISSRPELHIRETFDQFQCPVLCIDLDKFAPAEKIKKREKKVRKRENKLAEEECELRKRDCQLKERVAETGEKEEELRRWEEALMLKEAGVNELEAEEVQQREEVLKGSKIKEEWREVELTKRKETAWRRQVQARPQDEKMRRQREIQRRKTVEAYKKELEVSRGELEVNFLEALVRQREKETERREEVLHLTGLMEKREEEVQKREQGQKQEQDLKQRQSEKVTTFRRKLVIIGCGKTSLLSVFCNGPFSEVNIPTVFDNYVADVEVDGKHVELVLWNTSGLEDYDQHRALSYPGAHAILICFAVDSLDSLDNVQRKWIPEVRCFCPGLPVLLVGCKKDLRPDPLVIKTLKESHERLVTPIDGMAVAKKIGAKHYLECSAKTGEGVLEVFQYAARATLLTGNCHRTNNWLKTLLRIFHKGRRTFPSP